MITADLLLAPQRPRPDQEHAGGKDSRFLSEAVVRYSCCWHLHSGGGEVFTMDILTAFLVSVAAGVVSYYICKWLDKPR